MQHEDFSLDKEESIKNNVDATGKKWSIMPVRGFALYQVKAMDARVTIPKCLTGKWTKAAWLQDEVTKFVKESWDKAEKQLTKQVRQAEAAKEAAKQEKKEAATQAQPKPQAKKKAAKRPAKTKE